MVLQLSSYKGASIYVYLAYPQLILMLICRKLASDYHVNICNLYKKGCCVIYGEFMCMLYLAGANLISMCLVMQGWLTQHPYSSSLLLNF